MSSPAALRVAAPLAALAYPALVRLGTAVSPAFLVIALAVPVLALVTAYVLGRTSASAFVRLVAHVAIAAPPLYALLGGWLDFQHTLPFGSLGVWIPLWSALAIAALVDRRRAPQTILAAPRWLIAVHATSALVITLFAAVHVVNHLAGLFGGDAHVAVMHTLRTVYRHPVVEPLLLAAVVFQVASGGWLLARRLRGPAEWFPSLQTATGAYLLMFFASHVSAVFRARLLRNTDTDWSWLSGNELLTDPWSARLVPYYFLSVIALAVHAACGLRVVLRGHGVALHHANAVVAVIATLATVTSSLILAGLFRA
ncbi:MAG: hypothetical protein ABI867_18930 [Kofleriaceae bacterium]